MAVAALVVSGCMGYFCCGKFVKQKWIVYKTLQSPHWKERAAEIENCVPGKYKIIFFGNSLTELFDLNGYFNDRAILNCGIVGDFSEGLLKRAGSIVKLKPEKLFIEIGINDIIEQVPLAEICSNYEKLLKLIRQGSPHTEVYIQSNLPVIINRPSVLVDDRSVNEKLLEQNRNLRMIATRNGVVFIDLYAAFLRSGYVKDLLIEDGIHLNKKAYAVWKMTVLPYLNQTDNLR